MGANPLMVVGADLTKTYVPASGASTVTDISNLPFAPGTIITKVSAGNERRYKFVLVEDADVEAGDFVCYTTDDNGYEVSETNGENTNDVTQPAGVAMTNITDGYFGWIQTYGLNEVAMTGDGSVAAGEGIMPHATSDGVVDTWATNPALLAGQALADDSPTLAVGAVFLNCPKG